KKNSSYSLVCVLQLRHEEFPTVCSNHGHCSNRSLFRSGTCRLSIGVGGLCCRLCGLGIGLSGLCTRAGCFGSCTGCLCVCACSLSLGAGCLSGGTCRHGSALRFFSSSLRSNSIVTCSNSV